MANRDVRSAWEYHNRTKHSVASIRANPHYLDWENKPLPFKVYPDIEPIPLPRELPPSHVPALAAIAAEGLPAGSEALSPDLVSLARVLHFSAGITKKKIYPGGEEHYFRAAPCTGALYHIDVYVTCGDLPGLPAGVYHFGPHDFALRQLRSGDYRGVLVEASGAEPSVAAAPVIVTCASTYWRNSWKYQSRAYRHCYWDCGTLLANLLAAAAAERLPARVVCGFVDATVERLLGLDPQREGAVALVPLGFDPRPVPPASALTGVSFATLPLSPHEVDYPAIREMHAASALESASEVEQWRAAGAPLREFSSGLSDSVLRSDPTGSGPAELTPAAGPSRQTFPLRVPSAGALPEDTIDRVIARRGSTRQFAHVPIRFDQLSTVLACTTRGVAGDWGGILTETYVIVNAVDELPGGAYRYHREGERLEALRDGNSLLPSQALATERDSDPTRPPEASGVRAGSGRVGPPVRGPASLELLRAGDFRGVAGHLGLGQDLPADASVDIFFLSDLRPVLERFGNRGYRVAQLEAAILGGKVYLAAYALHLGASGLTFFDDDVTDFFSPDAAGKSVMFLVAVGRGRAPALRVR